MLLAQKLTMIVWMLLTGERLKATGKIVIMKSETTFCIVD